MVDDKYNTESCQNVFYEQLCLRFQTVAVRSGRLRQEVVRFVRRKDDHSGSVIFATDRSGLLNDLTKVFSEKDISIMRISSMTSKQGIATLMFGFEVKSREELHEIIARLQSVRDVRAIKRSNG